MSAGFLFREVMRGYDEEKEQSGWMALYAAVSDAFMRL